MARTELVILLFGVEEGLHAGNLELHLHRAGGFVDQLLKRAEIVLFRVEGTPHGREEVRILHIYDVLVVEMELTDKCRAQLCQEVERAAEKGHMSSDRLALCEAGDGLNHNCLENRGSQVLLSRAVIDEGLDIGLCEYAAAGRNGIERLVVLRVLVQALRVCLQERSHLVDKRACAACAGAVHPLLDVAVLKIDNLRILAAQLNCDVCLRRDLLDGGSLGHDLLDEGNTKVVGKRESAGSCDHGMNRDVRHLVVDLDQKSIEGLSDLGMVALIVAENKMVLRIHERNLDCSGTDINSEGVIFCDQIYILHICDVRGKIVILHPGYSALSRATQVFRVLPLTSCIDVFAEGFYLLKWYGINRVLWRF